MAIQNSSSPTKASISGRGSGSSAWPSMKIAPPDHLTDFCNRGEIRSVPAVMNYVSPETVEISTRRDTGGSDSTLVGATWDPTVVRVANARHGVGGDGSKLSLDTNGFELWSSQVQPIELLKEIDYLDQDQVVDKYYPSCEHIVTAALQSQSSHPSPRIAGVYAFDHNVRCKEKFSCGTIKPASQSKDADIAPQIQQPAGIVHADYTRTSAPKRLDDLSKPPKLNDVLRPKLLAEKRASLLEPGMIQEALDGKRRFAFINVWRNIDAENPVKDCPLACVDASTTSMDHLRVFKIHYVDRVGENYFVCPSANHSEQSRQHDWYYYPDMTMNEALLLKQWDSNGGIAKGYDVDNIKSHLSTFTVHSAFLDPSCPDVPPRRSIEVRCVVVWEAE